MRFHSTSLPNARTVELEPRGDIRGSFARVFCEREFAAANCETRIANVSASLSARAGTLRGLHYQLGGSAEAKIVRCVRGAFWDVIVDLRPDSPAFGRWFGETLSAENRMMMFIPKGFAHGLITLERNTEALYLSSSFYSPADERGLRWDDPRFAIEWPRGPVVISEKDACWPLFEPEFHGIEQLRGFTEIYAGSS